MYEKFDIVTVVGNVKGINSRTIKPREIIYNLIRKFSYFIIHL